MFSLLNRRCSAKQWWGLYLLGRKDEAGFVYQPYRGLHTFDFENPKDAAALCKCNAVMKQLVDLAVENQFVGSARELYNMKVENSDAIDLIFDRAFNKLMDMMQYEIEFGRLSEYSCLTIYNDMKKFLPKAK